MSQIDLKFATIYIEDGYDGPSGASAAKVNNSGGYSASATTIAVDDVDAEVVTGDRFTVAGDDIVHTITAHTEPVPAGSPAVNNMAGYAASATTMAVDGITGIVPVTQRFTVVGSTATHKVTAHTETLGNTTSITFTPGLTGTVADDAVITWIADTRTITFTPALGDAVLDNAAITWLPHQLEVNIGEGNCTYDESRNMQYKLNKGNLDTVREGDQAPMDVKIDANWEFLRSSSGDPPTIEEVLKKVGAASDWVSSSDDPCEPYSVNLIIDYIPPCGDVQAERITLPDYRWEKLSHDPKAGTLSTSGKCNATVAIVARYDQA